jgi:hypothetical protein
MSPFKSKKQQKWMFKFKPEMAKEWAHETPNIKALPERVKKKKKPKKKARAERLGFSIDEIVRLASLFEEALSRG